MRVIGGVVVLVYLLVGVLIANNHHYLANLSSLKEVISAILAVVLWPLVLVGVDLHLGKAGGGGGKAGAIVVLSSIRRMRFGRAPTG